MKQDWEIKKLKDVTSLITDGDWIESRHQSEDGIRLIQTGNVGNGFFKAKDDKPHFISEETFDVLGCTEIFEGDCLVSRLPDPVGRACLIPEMDCRMITAVDCSIIRFNEILVPDFFVYYSQSSKYQNEISNKTTGTTRKRISRKNLEMIPISVPTLAEQEKIVAELDCLSGIIEKKKQQLKELDNLAQSIFYEMFGNSHESVPLSYYIEHLSAGKSLAGDEECKNKVLKTGAVTYDYFDGTQVKNLPLEYVPLQSHKVCVTDVLISRMNTAELVGACAYVWKVDDSTYLPDRLWRAEIKDCCNPIFLWKAIITEKAKEQIRNYASGTSGSMKNISKPSFLKVEIPKVPLSEQQDFASKIESIEKQKELIAQSIKETETLFYSRMDYYFN